MASARWSSQRDSSGEGTIHVVHSTDYPGEPIKGLLTRAKDPLDEAGLDDEPDRIREFRASKPRSAGRVGRGVLRLVDENDHDHVVVGHHGSGRIGRAILGSAAEPVVRAPQVPSAFIP